MLAETAAGTSPRSSGSFEMEVSDWRFDTRNGEYVDCHRGGHRRPDRSRRAGRDGGDSTAVTVLRSSVVIAQPLSGGRYAGTVAEGGPANLTMK